MKINNYTNIQNINNNIHNSGENTSNNDYSRSIEFSYTYPAVYFCKKIPVKKVVNIAQEKDKLIKQLDKLLEENTADMDPIDIFFKNIQRLGDFIRRKREKNEKLLMMAEELLNDKTLSPQQKREAGIHLKKEKEKLDKSKPTKYVPPKKKEDTKTDFALLNKFKTAAEGDNFDLIGIYKEHYSGLDEVTTIKELNERYPHIEIPKRPEEIVGEKISKSLPRAFYTTLKDLLETGKDEEIATYMFEQLRNIVSTHIPEYSSAKHLEILDKIIKDATISIGKRTRDLKRTNGFNGIPEQVKIKTPIFTESDKKLLEVNYDDFFLSVIREQYLGLKKPADIIYDNGSTQIKLSEIQKEGYKFPKISEKIKSFISTGEQLKSAQRDYDRFTEEEFKKRFTELADSPLGENEEFLEKILDFDSCRYTEEDIEMAKAFLREADKVNDGEKSIDEALEYIRQNGIRPNGTKKLNDNEQKEYMERLKQEQKARALLAHEQRIFDESINILYANNMGFLADMCLKYRPNKNNGGNYEDAKFIADLIAQQVNGKNKKIANKQKLYSTLYRWHTYKKYCTDPEADKELLKKAQRFAMQEDGQIDTDKAGQYITNVETLEAYKKSPESVPNSEIVKLIKENTPNDRLAVEYLCKYDEYNCLDDDSKTRIEKILELFDGEDNLDNKIINNILENDYIQTETRNVAQEGGTKITTVIGPNAKSEIFYHYKYPNCLEYFKLFEDAATRIAFERKSAGVKALGKNNKNLEGMYELKIKGHDDRLITTKKGECYFDEFSLNGLH